MDNWPIVYGSPANLLLFFLFLSQTGPGGFSATQPMKAQFHSSLSFGRTALLPCISGHAIAVLFYQLGSRTRSALTK
jgi:hypothetical protein